MGDKYRAIVVDMHEGAGLVEPQGRERDAELRRDEGLGLVSIQYCQV